MSAVRKLAGCRSLPDGLGVASSRTLPDKEFTAAWDAIVLPDDVKQRLARWLLITHDRLQSDVIRTTHEFLSKMIGTDRPTISVAVAELEVEGILGHTRGSIVITNRPMLEGQACECYAAIKKLNADLGL